MNGIAMKKIMIEPCVVNSCPKCSAERKPCVGEAAQQHHHREHDVHDADLLVIDAGQPLRPQRRPLAVPGDQRRDGHRAHDHDPGRHGGDDAVDDLGRGGVLDHAPEGQGVEPEPAEQPMEQGAAAHPSPPAAAFAGG
jgi:hypothetical protein